MEPQLSGRYGLLRQFFASKAKVAVAFSGGVDSSLVLHAAADSIGRENVLALHARLAFQPEEDATHVVEIADLVGCPVHILPINPLEWPEFVENPVNRCYICKKKIFRAFWDHLKKEKIDCLVDGTNADDLQQFRPGLKALVESKVASPLAEAGFRKTEIRTLSRFFSLPTWSKPSASCLATRIDNGQPITAEKLAVVAAIEQFLSERGFMGSRARLSCDRILLELQHADNAIFFGYDCRQDLLEYVKQWGIHKVYLDILGRE